MSARPLGAKLDPCPVTCSNTITSRATAASLASIGGQDIPLHVARHLVEMFLAMMAGMMVGAFVLATVVGTGVSETRHEHAVAWVFVMAFDMTVPMVAVMLYRGHSRRSAGEMAAAMIVPALPIVALQLSDIVSGQLGRVYDADERT